MQPTASELLALRARESTYPGTVENISTVRADLRPLLHDCPVADEVILCASELAANAALHSNSRLPGGTFIVRMMISRGDFVRVDVQDDGGPWTPAITAPTNDPGGVSPRQARRPPSRTEPDQAQVNYVTNTPAQ